MTAETDAVGREVEERQPHIVADVMDDHRAIFDHDGDFATCRCDGTRWETPDWRLHVGREVVAALAEDRDTYGLPPIYSPATKGGGDDA